MRKSVVALVIIVFAFSFNTLDNFNEENAIIEIENLLNERIIIINDFLFQENDFTKLKTKLINIEDNTLLDSDLEILSRVICNPTDYELAKGVKIENVISFDISDKEVNLIAYLNWTSIGYDGEKHILKKYHIQCIIDNDRMLLTNMENIQ